jgi:hypothetical protein
MMVVFDLLNYFNVTQDLQCLFTCVVHTFLNIIFTAQYRLRYFIVSRFPPLYRVMQSKYAVSLTLLKTAIFMK